MTDSTAAPSMYTTEWTPDLPAQPPRKALGSLRVVNEKEVTVDDVVKAGDDAWKLCKRLLNEYKSEYEQAARKHSEAKTPREKEDALDMRAKVDEKIMSAVRKKFPEFAMSYAIVLRHNLSLRRYHSDALRNYVKHIAAHPWTTEDEYLRAQAHYAVCLYKATVHPWNETVASYTFNTVYSTLKQDHEKFKVTAEEASKKVSAFETTVRKKREAALLAWLESQHGAKVGAPTETTTNPLLEGMRAFLSDKPVVHT